jgi:hypothetical protein
LVTLNVIHELIVAHNLGSDSILWKIRGLLGAKCGMSNKEVMNSLELTFSPSPEWNMANYFAEGDFVQFSLGYTDSGCPPLTNLFEGNVKTVDAGTPITVTCFQGHDEFKKKQFSHTYISMSYKQIAQDIIDRMGYRMVTPAEWSIFVTPEENYRVDEKTPEKAMDELCERCFAEWYPIGGGEVYFGELQQSRVVAGEKPVFISGRNVFDEMSNIKFKSKTNYKKVKVRLRDADNEQAEFIGTYTAQDYVEGDKVATFVITCGSPNQILANQIAQRHYELMIKGFGGSFVAIGDPRVVKGCTVKIKNWKFPDSDGYDATVTGCHHYYGEPSLVGLYSTTFDCVGSSVWIG